MIDDVQAELSFGEGLSVPGCGWLVNWQTSLANWKNQDQQQRRST